jgi:DmsE family decaheme c-type cytochrome
MRVHIFGWRGWVGTAALIAMGLFAANQLPARTIQHSQNKTQEQKAAAPPLKPAAAYVGTDTCKTCHADVFKDNFENTPHYKTLLEKSAGPSKQGCEGCHGPGSLHVASGGQTPVPYDFPKMTAQAIAERCMTCHQSRHENEHFLNSVHFEKGVTCTDCHSPHHSNDPNFLLVKAQPQLCFTCHRTIQALFHMPFHHKVIEGMVQCTDCHNPHGSVTDLALNPLGENKQLRSGIAGDAVCFNCHVDKQGPFVYEHEPIKTEGCTACHTPHGSPNPHLLKYANVNQLCMQCHTPSTFSGAPGVPSFHTQTAKYQACTMCHTQIHGSNVSPIFFQ